MTRTLIAGLGNIFECDDGFGPVVVRELVKATWPDGVEVRDYGIRGIHLAYQLLEGYDAVVLVDAVQRGNRPGTLYLIDHASDAGRTPIADEAMLDSHDLNPDAVLALVPELGGTLGRVTILGCEPQRLGFGMELSPTVAGSVNKAAQLVRELVAEVYGNGTTNQTRIPGGRGGRSGGRAVGRETVSPASFDVTVS